MANLGAAVVGTGFIGPVHVEALRRLGRPVQGILSSSSKKSYMAASLLGTPNTYARYEQLLADPEVKVVHIASPNRFHYEQARLALFAGKHVICEKPLAMTAAETADLAALAQHTPVITAVNYNVRFYPLNLEARQRVAEGKIGQVYHVTGSYAQDWLLYDTDFNWRVLADEGGALRAVADIGTHWLDVVQAVTGLQVEAVCADLKTFLPVRQQPREAVDTFKTRPELHLGARSVNVTTEDYGAVLLRFRGGATGSFYVSQVMAGRKNSLRYEIAGSKASLAWDSEQPNELWVGRRDGPSEVLPRDPALMPPALRRFANYPAGHHEGFPDTFKQLFRAVYDYIEEGDWQAPRPFPTFADGHCEMVLCEAILKSHKERRWVYLTGMSPAT